MFCIHTEWLKIIERIMKTLNPDKVLDGDIDSFLESSLYKINA